VNDYGLLHGILVEIVLLDVLEDLEGVGLAVGAGLEGVQDLLLRADVGEEASVDEIDVDGCVDCTVCIEDDTGELFEFLPAGEGLVDVGVGQVLHGPGVVQDHDGLVTGELEEGGHEFGVDLLLALELLHQLLRL